MRSVEMKNRCLLYYGNPVGYQTECGMVADTMFRREELEGWLARKGLSVRWEDGVYDRLSTGGYQALDHEQAVSLIGKAWRLTAEETSEQLALIEQEKAVMGRIENGEPAEHIRQELLLNWSGLESIEVLEDLFETSTLLETAPERRSLFDMAMLLIETQNLLDWIEKTDAEKEELIQNFT